MNLKRIFLYLFLVLCLQGFLLSSLPAEPVFTEQVEAEIVSEVTALQPGQPFWVALRMKMKEGWHTYWVNAGDAGDKTRIIWDLPAGFRAGPIKWPHPEQMAISPLMNYGYEGEVLLLTEITPPKNLNDGDEVVIYARADWLVCSDVCLPGNADLEIKLRVDSKGPQGNEKRIEDFARARSDLPLEPELSGWEIKGYFDESRIVLEAVSPDAAKIQDVNDMYFFPLEGNIIVHAAAQKLGKTPDGYLLEIERSDLTKGELKRLEGVLVSDTGWRGKNSEKALRVEVSPEAIGDKVFEILPVSTKTFSGVWMAFLFAFLGGLILNLMPCVLPVLSIKILGFVKQAGEDKKKILLHGIVFAAGVLVSFWVLAGVLIILRAGGAELGWGFQLQSPRFLIILSSILFLFGLNLFGVFEVGTSLQGIGGSVSRQSGMAGSFWSGVLATVVATPCTAPFMGSALGYAMTQPVVVSFVIFTALGSGMALPFLLLSMNPKLLKFVPKPGPWMVTLKQFMGFLLMATVIWLLWVLGLQTGCEIMTTMLASLLMLSMGGWILGKWAIPVAKTSALWTARIIAAVFIIGGIMFALYSVGVGPDSARGLSGISSRKGIVWETFSEELLEESRKTGKAVFLDFSAAWCLTCQVNERITFHDAEVIEKFEKKNIIPLKADWTKKDPLITRALASFGRTSVPLYVLYPPGAKSDPIILPEVLMPKIVLEALDKI